MTPKQRMFAQKIIEGFAPSEAYRLAYSADGMSAKSIANEANRLLKNPDIAPMIAEGVSLAMKESIWNRKTAIERLKSVNDTCFDRIASSDQPIDKSAVTAFLETTDRLNTLCCVADEVRDAQKAYNQDPDRIKQRKQLDEEAFNAEIGAF